MEEIVFFFFFFGFSYVEDELEGREGHIGPNQHEDIIIFGMNIAFLNLEKLGFKILTIFKSGPHNILFPLLKTKIQT